MLTTYLNALKNKGNFTYETISNLSGIPEATVKNIFSGKTEDPRFETVSAIVVSMGGSLDAVYSVAKKEDVEANAVIAIKEIYEQRLADQEKYYEKMLADQEKYFENRLLDKKEHIDTIILDKRWFRLASVVSVVALIGLIVLIEAITPGHGWFRY